MSLALADATTPEILFREPDAEPDGAYERGARVLAKKIKDAWPLADFRSTVYGNDWIVNHHLDDFQCQHGLRLLVVVTKALTWRLECVVGGHETEQRELTTEEAHAVMGMKNPYWLLRVMHGFVVLAAAAFASAMIGGLFYLLCDVPAVRTISWTYGIFLVAFMTASRGGCEARRLGFFAAEPEHCQYYLALSPRQQFSAASITTDVNHDHSLPWHLPSPSSTSSR